MNHPEALVAPFSLSPRLVVADGRLHARETLQLDEVVSPGVKLVVLFDGELDLEGSRDGLHAEANRMYLLRGTTSWQLRHAIATGARLSYLSMHLDEATSRDVGLVDPSHAPVPTLSGCVAPLSRPMAALARQIADCPLRGGSRQLFVAGKAMELLSLAAMQGETMDEMPRRHERECARAAAAWLRDHPADALRPSELARRLGLGVRVLRKAFVACHGMDMASYQRDVRMQLAWRLLAAGDTSVTDIAVLVGYTPAHFSTAFRRRFGYAPSRTGH